MKEISLFLGAAVISWLLGSLAYRLLLTWRVVDYPNSRSSHKRPTVLGGGVAIFATITVIGCWIAWSSSSRTLGFLIAVSGLLSLISFWDDIRELPASVRFCFHLFASALILSTIEIYSWKIVIYGNHEWLLPWQLALVIGLLWLTGYTNAFNFMDGINGLAAGQATVTAAGMAMIAGFATGVWGHPAVTFSLVVAGSAAGFLPHNFPKAKMFMGDVGSAPLGFLLAALAIWLASELGWWLLIPLSLLHVNFILDTGITLLRRISKRDQWHKPHRQHFYQRLVRSGRSHAYVTGSEMGIQTLAFLIAIAYLPAGPVTRVSLIALLIGLWCIFFLFCEKELKKSIDSMPEYVEQIIDETGSETSAPKEERRREELARTAGANQRKEEGKQRVGISEDTELEKKSK